MILSSNIALSDFLALCVMCLTEHTHKKSNEKNASMLFLFKFPKAYFLN